MSTGLVRLHKGAQWLLWVVADGEHDLDEVDVANAWLYQTLHTDAPLLSAATDVYQGVVPEGAIMPYVNFFFQVGQDDVQTYDGETSVLQYVVKVVDQVDQGQGASAAVRKAVARLKALLQRSDSLTVPVTGGTVSACTRRAPWYQEDYSSGT